MIQIRSIKLTRNEKVARLVSDYLHISQQNKDFWAAKRRLLIRIEFKWVKLIMRSKIQWKFHNCMVKLSLKETLDCMVLNFLAFPTQKCCIVDFTAQSLEYDFTIRCTNKFPPFFIKNRAFIMKERNIMFYSEYCPSYCSSCVWHESWSNNVSNSALSYTFGLPLRSLSSMLIHRYYQL